MTETERHILAVLMVMGLVLAFFTVVFIVCAIWTGDSRWAFTALVFFLTDVVGLVVVGIIVD